MKWFLRQQRSEGGFQGCLVGTRIHVISSGRCLSQSQTPRNHCHYPILLAFASSVVMGVDPGGLLQIAHGLHRVRSTLSLPLPIDIKLHISNLLSCVVVNTRISRRLGEGDIVWRANFIKSSVFAHSQPVVEHILAMTFCSTRFRELWEIPLSRSQKGRTAIHISLMM